MSTGSHNILGKPVRRRRASFVLTSLIDVIFLLVIFFMVSSQITPFSLISLGAVGSAASPSEPPTEIGRSPPVAVRILAGRVAIGGSNIAIADLASTLAGLKRNGITGLLLIPGAGSTVQDLVTTLEAAKAAAIVDVTIIDRQGASS